MNKKLKIKKTFSGPKSGNKTNKYIQSSFKPNGDCRINKISEATGNTTGSTGNAERQRIAIYARVSTANQGKEDTVKSQIKAIQDHLTDKKIKVAPEHVYVDEGFSGSTLARPSLDKLRDAIAAYEYEKVFIYDPDRLARSYVYQVILIEEFEKFNCLIEFIRRPIGKTPDEHLLLQMQGVIAEYERTKISERTRRGKMHKMLEGIIVSGHRTFGYKYFKKSSEIPAHYEIIKEEAEIVRKMYEWYTSEKISLRGIATRLNEAGIRTARGNTWHGSSMHQILQNTMYTGTGYANRIKCVLPKDRPLEKVYRKYSKSGKQIRPREDWIPFSCPAIIDEESFELAQERFEHNKTNSARRTKKEYLLTGLVKCPACDRRMSANGRTMKYFCTYTQKSNAADSGKPVCKNDVKIPVEELDKLVWEELIKMIKKPENLKKYYKQYSGKIVPRASKGLSVLEKKKQKAAESIKRVNSLFIRGMIDEFEHKKQYKILKDKVYIIDQQIGKNSKEHLKEKEIEQILSSFNNFSKTIKSQLNNIDFFTKRSIIEQLIKSVIISAKTITIEFAAPVEKRTLCTVGCNP